MSHDPVAHPYRVGPPTPRSDTSFAAKAMTFGMGDEGAFEARAAALAAYHSRMADFFNRITKAAAEDGFYAGWDARRQFDLNKREPGK